MGLSHARRVPTSVVRVCVGQDTKLERCKSSCQVFAEPKARHKQGRRCEAGSEGGRRRSGGFLRCIVIWVSIGSVEECLVRRVFSPSQQNQRVMGSTDAWSNGQDIPTNVPRLDWFGRLAGFVCEGIVAGLAFPALGQPLIHQGSQQEPRRIDALAIEQTP